MYSSSCTVSNVAIEEMDVYDSIQFVISESNSVQ